jgi:hypothetical protein
MLVVPPAPEGSPAELPPLDVELPVPVLKPVPPVPPELPRASGRSGCGLSEQAELATATSHHMCQRIRMRRVASMLQAKANWA